MQCFIFIIYPWRMILLGRMAEVKDGQEICIPLYFLYYLEFLKIKLYWLTTDIPYYINIVSHLCTCINLTSPSSYIQSYHTVNFVHCAHSFPFFSSKHLIFLVTPVVICSLFALVIYIPGKREALQLLPFTFSLGTLSSIYIVTKGKIP